MESSSVILKEKRGNKNNSIRYQSDDEVRSALKELFIYILFLFVGVVVTTSAHHDYMFHMHHSIQNLFITNPAYYDIITTADWWNYVELHFLPYLLGDNYGNGVVEERYFLQENILLGAPRLRQIHVRNDTCHISDAFKRYFFNCYAQYYESIEEKNTFQGYEYYASDELKSRPIWALYNTYYGGGYKQDFDYNLEKSLTILRNLKAENWISRATRVIVIEFGLYNANGNFFINVKLIAETPISGGIISSEKIESFNMHAIWTDNDYFVEICAVVFYFMTFVYTVLEIKECISIHFRHYIQSFWNSLDIIVLTLSYMSFIYQIVHIILVKNLLKNLSNDPAGYHCLDNICFWSSFYKDVMGICIFLICIKIFKFISFNKTMLHFSTTLKRCSKDLLGFAVMFFIVFLAYAQLGLLLFGTHNYDFSTFWISVITLVRMILGDFDYSSLERANRVLGPIYFLTYILLVFFILLNMFLAIINDTYSAIKEEITHGQNHLGTFLKQKLDEVFKKLCKCASRNTKTKAKDAPIDVVIITDTISRTDPVQPEIIQVRESVLLRDYFEIYEPPEISILEFNRAKLDSLIDRVTLLEKILEGLIEDLDKILFEVQYLHKKNH